MEERKVESKKSACGFLKFILGLTWAILVMAGIAGFSDWSSRNSATHGDVVAHVTCLIFLFAMTLFVIFELMKILNTVQNKKPFCIKNVKRFKTIATCILIFGLFDSIFNHTSGGIKIIDIEYPYQFSISASILVYIILGCLALVLAEVFNAAIKIKDENDLTI